MLLFNYLELERKPASILEMNGGHL